MSSESNVEYLRANLNIKGMSNSRRTSLSNVDYMLFGYFKNSNLLGPSRISKFLFYLHSAVSGILCLMMQRLGFIAFKRDEKWLNLSSLTEAEEEAVAREVHATHARIVSGPDLEPMQEDQTGSNSGKLHVSLAGPKT
ncbi:hypothetical protein Tco_0954869 [Tanacetum coccineum]|uniref:Uncharacterized protein n=1 Tax=Tanacetum coccineum TaxID=301880 RepID=A0ABQ5E5N2_9ASTR